MSRFLEKLEFVKPADLVSGLKMLVSIPYAACLKKKRKQMWLICEEYNEARDNGYWLYKYIRKAHPEQDVVYAINKESVDYEKIKNLGEVIQYGSIKHWAYYLAASINISSQKGGKPNAAVCYLLEVYGILKNTRVFLQHGVIENDLPFLHYENTKMRMFITTAPREHQFICEKFGYPDGWVKCVGIARLDGLHDAKVKKNQILVMPTWRKWISVPSSVSATLDDMSSFEATEYCKCWMEVLRSSEIEEWLANAGMELVFYPHRNMQKFISFFKTESKHVKIADWEHYDVQQLLKESAFLITDYSSIFNDFAYMRKPMIYYQFDNEKFRKAQYEEGYFSFKEDGFGPVCETFEELKTALKRAIDENLKNPEVYLNREKEFFTIWDTDNCKRNYEEIKKLQESL